MWNRALAMIFVLGMTFAALGAETAEISVDLSKEHQRIEGFGTCLVSWVSRFQELYRTPQFQRMYVDELSCNMLRVNLWGPVSPEPVEDWRNIRWQDFDMSVNGGRAQVFVDFGKGIRELNPDVKIIGTVWSPPAWMKENRSITRKEPGGARAHSYRGSRNRVLPQYFDHFARWMVEMVKLHEARGAPLYAVSPGNEVQFSQTFESCVWTGEDYAQIVAILGRMLEEEGYGHVKIFGPETMTSHFYEGGTPDYVQALVSHPEASRHLDVFATHGYADDGFTMDINANSSRRFWELIEPYDKPFWITEGGTGAHEWPEPIRNGVATGIHNALVAGNCSAFVPWQVIGRGPNTHCLMVLSDDGPTYTPKTYAAVHYFRFIPPDSVRVQADPAYGEVMASAYKHPNDVGITLVLLNPHDRPRPANVRVSGLPASASFQMYRTSDEERAAELQPVEMVGGKLHITMPPRSIVTLVYSP